MSPSRLTVEGLDRVWYFFPGARLGLDVLIYDPQVHYQQVRDAWTGVRNPDGR